MMTTREMREKFESEFTIADVRALKEASQRSKIAMLNEEFKLDGEDIAGYVIKFIEIFGRKGVIALLKGIRFVNDYRDC